MSTNTIVASPKGEKCKGKKKTGYGCSILRGSEYGQPFTDSGYCSLHAKQEGMSVDKSSLTKDNKRSAASSSGGDVVRCLGIKANGQQCGQKSNNEKAQPFNS